MYVNGHRNTKTVGSKHAHACTMVGWIANVHVCQYIQRYMNHATSSNPFIAWVIHVCIQYTPENQLYACHKL